MLFFSPFNFAIRLVIFYWTLVLFFYAEMTLNGTNIDEILFRHSLVSIQHFYEFFVVIGVTWNAIHWRDGILLSYIHILAAAPHRSTSTSRIPPIIRVMMTQSYNSVYWFFSLLFCFWLQITHFLYIIIGISPKIIFFIVKSITLTPMKIALQYIRRAYVCISFLFN